MKGIAALMFECWKARLTAFLPSIDSISSTFDGIPFIDHLNRLVTGTAIHAHRRAVELEGSIKMLEEAGLCYDMTAASHKRHTMLEPYRFAERFIDRNPNGWKEILDIINSEKHDK